MEHGDGGPALADVSGPDESRGGQKPLPAPNPGPRRLVIIAKKPGRALGKQPKIFPGGKTRLTRGEGPDTMDAEKNWKRSRKRFQKPGDTHRGQFPAGEMRVGK